MKACLRLVSLCIAVAIPAAVNAAEPSVVNVFATVRYPNPIRPWTTGNPMETGGSGVVIEGHKILTCAHIVLYATEVRVQPRPGEPKVEAKVEAIGLDVDLAVLSVDDQKFFKKQPPLPRAEKLPKIQDNVAVYGFPIGGNGLSVTKGVVSRVSFGQYDQGGLGLMIQTSAAINPGNSGGPAVVDGKMIGIVYSRLDEAQNIGYVVPNEEVDHFLSDIKDGRYDGKLLPPGGTQYQRLENTALRSMLKLDKDVQGLLVLPPRHHDRTYPFREFDVLTRIGEHPIDNDGMVLMSNDFRVFFSAVIPKLARDGAVPMTLLRNGQSIKVALPVSCQNDQLIRRYQGEQPSYFIHGPLVFSPAKAEAIVLYGRLNPSIYAGSLLLNRRFDRTHFADEELVVVTAPMFLHKITRGYGDPVGQVVEKVNGTRIKNLRHLVEIIRDSTADYLEFRFVEETAEVLVFSRREMNEATLPILEENGIAPSRRASKDMLAVWTKSK